MNIERARIVLDAIKQNREHFNMDTWICDKDANDGWTTFDVKEADLGSCGTVACIAGWTVHCFDYFLDGRQSCAEAAAHILGLGDRDASLLFQEPCEVFPRDEVNDRALEFFEDCINAGKVLDPDEWYEELDA